MSTIVTRNSLQHMLDAASPEKLQAIVGRALVALFDRQTRDEKAINDTQVWNAVGFSGADGKSGSLTAKYYLKHKKLEDWQVARWTKKGKNGFARLCKYHKQLNDIAEHKAAVKQGVHCD